MSVDALAVNGAEFNRIVDQMNEDNGTQVYRPARKTSRDVAEDREGKEGKKCMYDLTCGMGYSCHKGSGRMVGVCVKN